MLKTLAIFLFVSASFYIGSHAFAESFVRTPEGLLFEVNNASLVSSDGTRRINIPLTITNQTDNKKIDLDQEFNFVLSDEFNNHYRLLSRSDEQKETSDKGSSGLPGLYPGESFVRDLSFEAPVEKATTLKLGIDMPLIWTGLAVELDLAVPKPPVIIAPTIDVEPSEDGAVVNVGEVFHLRVTLNPGKLPVNLLIVAFGNTLEDVAPAQNNDYNIVVPVNAPDGPASISVIARWNDAKKGIPQIMSKNIIIYVSHSKQIASF